jgi:hypothetical protein
MPYPLFKTLHNTCENMQRFMQKEFEKNSNRARRKQPRNVRAAASFLDAKAAEPGNSRNTTLQTGSQLRRSPYIIYIRTAEK